MSDRFRDVAGMVFGWLAIFAVGAAVIKVFISLARTHPDGTFWLGMLAFACYVINERAKGVRDIIQKQGSECTLNKHSA